MIGNGLSFCLNKGPFQSSTPNLLTGLYDVTVSRSNTVANVHSRLSIAAVVEATVGQFDAQTIRNFLCQVRVRITFSRKKERINFGSSNC